MNKHQEALDFLCDNSKLTQFNIGQSQWASETLQELVDKATPIKPIQVIKTFRNIDLSMFDCPKCNLGVMPSAYPPGLNDYCSHCGQRLDWSDDE